MDETQEKARPADVGPGVAPNHCRVIGTVTTIEAVGGSGNDPCSKSPCIAVIRLDRILGYGSAFTKPLAEGQSIRMRFEFTTGPTRDLFPGMAPALPGLSLGSRFQADVRSEGPSMGSNEPSFVVGQYSLK